MSANELWTGLALINHLAARMSGRIAGRRQGCIH